MPNAVASEPEPLTSTSRSRAPLVIGIFVVVVALDQLSKAWMVARHSFDPVSIWGTTVELRLSRNAGSAFSFFRGFTPLLAVLAVAVAVFLIRAVRRTQDRVMLVALSLVLAGAVGNLCDRVFRAPGVLSGAVVDFIKVGGWPTFNVADSAITVGALLLLVWGWRGVGEETPDAGHEAPDAP